MDPTSPGKPATKKKANGKPRGKPMQTSSNRATVHSIPSFKVAPITVKGLSNTSRRSLDATLREKLPGLKIDNISFNPKAKLYTIQSTDVHTYQKLLNNFPTDSFANDKNPSIFVPSTIRQVVEVESVCFMKNVDLEFDEDELRQALSNDGIQIRQLERIT